MILEPSPRVQNVVREFALDTSSTSPEYGMELASGKTLRVTGTLHRVIRLLDGTQTPADVARAMRERYSTDLSEEDINRIIRDYLLPHGLIGGEVGCQQSHIKLKMSLVSESKVTRVSDVLAVLFSPRLGIAAAVMSAIFHILSYWRGDLAFESFGQATETWYAWALLLVLSSSFFHELGHGAACRSQQAEAGEIGIGLYGFIFAFFTDLNRCWRLPRLRRAIIDAGGMYFQYLFAGVVGALFLLTEEPGLLCGLYFIDLALVINCNPFLRFDGYWLLADILGVPNLRSRMKEQILALIPQSSHEVAPWPLRTPLRIAVLLYGVCTAAVLGWFTYRLAVRLPNLLLAYPGILRDAADTVLSAVPEGAWMRAVFGVQRLLFPTLLLVGLGYLVGSRLAVFVKSHWTRRRRTAA